jgi:hypothetical protein
LKNAEKEMEELVPTQVAHLVGKWDKYVDDIVRSKSYESISGLLSPGLGEISRYLLLCYVVDNNL